MGIQDILDIISQITYNVGLIGLAVAIIMLLIKIFTKKDTLDDALSTSCKVLIGIWVVHIITNIWHLMMLPSTIV